MRTQIDKRKAAKGEKVVVMSIEVKKIVPEQVRLREENSTVMKSTAEMTDVLSVSLLLQKIYGEMSI